VVLQRRHARVGLCLRPDLRGSVAGRGRGAPPSGFRGSWRQAGASSRSSPVAQGACQAYLDDAAGAVLSSGPDGLEGGWIPGYFVFLGTEAGDTFLCNATANAQVWVFARIGAPLQNSAPVG
jgi:hypothetical protein